LIAVAEANNLLEVVFSLAGEVVRLCLLAAQRSLKLGSRPGDLGLLLLVRQPLRGLKLGNPLGQCGKLLLKLLLGSQPLLLPGVVERGGGVLFESLQATGKLALLGLKLLELGIVLARDLGDPPCQLCVELRPPRLLGILLLQDEADGLLSAWLGYAA